MAEFKQGVLTSQGLDLLAKAQAGKASIEFTKFQIGNGEWDPETSPETLMRVTSLRGLKGEYGVTKSEYINEATTKLTLTASNRDNTSGGFYITEVGIYASDGSKEVLYAVYITQQSKADWFPAYNSITPSSITYTCPISVANASNVTIAESGAGLALQKDLEAAVGRITALEQGAAACVGVKRKCTADGTPQSSTVWERFGQTVGKTAVYARGNEAVDDELMKMWPFNRIRPCNLAMDGTVVAYLGEPAFDWTASTDATTDSSVMVEIPTEMYFSRWQEKDPEGQNWEYRVFADSPRYPNAVYLKELFRRSDGTESNAFYFPVFIGSLNAAGHYVSVAETFPQYDTSCIRYREEVKTNGANWQIIDKWAWDIFTNLCLCYSADNNFKTTFGKGHCNWYAKFTSQAAAESTNVVTLPKNAESQLSIGDAISIGAKQDWQNDVAKDRLITEIKESETMEGMIDVTVDGEPFTTTTQAVLWKSAPKIGETISMTAANGTAGENDGKHAVRTLWVEDLYGTMHTGLDGMNLKFNEEKMALEIYVLNDPEKYSDTYDNYTLLNAQFALNKSGNNYDNNACIKKSIIDSRYPELELPVEIGGGAGTETYMAAYRWTSKNGQRPFVGGAFYYGGLVSPFSLICIYGFGYSYRYYASRPLKR